MVHICEIPHSIRRVDYVFYHMSDVVVIVHELYNNLDKWLVHFWELSSTFLLHDDSSVRRW